MTLAGAWVYIMTNKSSGVLYVGATQDLRARSRAHRSGRGSAFTAKYNCGRLVYFEEHPTIEAARARELKLKDWHRAWKMRLTESQNPEWIDLCEVAPARMRPRPSPG